MTRKPALNVTPNPETVQPTPKPSASVLFCENLNAMAKWYRSLEQQPMVPFDVAAERILRDVSKALELAIKGERWIQP